MAAEWGSVDSDTVNAVAATYWKQSKVFGPMKPGQSAEVDVERDDDDNDEVWSFDVRNCLTSDIADVADKAWMLGPYMAADEFRKGIPVAGCEYFVVTVWNDAGSPSEEVNTTVRVKIG